MQYLLDTTDTIVKGVGFPFYGGLHIAWLIAAVLFFAVSAIVYRKCTEKGRVILRKGVALAIVADEIFKMAVLFAGGNYMVDYLPVHLCSINIFLIAYHAWKGGKVLDNYLYTVGIPGALVALLFPSWSELPGYNLMCIHSFTVHILLAGYPLMLFLGGEIKPNVKLVPRCVALLGGLALIALVFNLVFDTNFMFLMSASEGNPLKLFENMWGSHLWGFAVIIPAVIVVMHAPILLYRKWKEKKQTASA